MICFLLYFQTAYFCWGWKMGELRWECGDGSVGTGAWWGERWFFWYFFHKSRFITFELKHGQGKWLFVSFSVFGQHTFVWMGEWGRERGSRSLGMEGIFFWWSIFKTCVFQFLYIIWFLILFSCLIHKNIVLKQTDSNILIF